MLGRRIVAITVGLLLGGAASVLVLYAAGVSPRALVERATTGRAPTTVHDLHERDDTIGYVLLPNASFRHETSEFDVDYHVDAGGGRRVPGTGAGLRVDVYGDSWTFGHGVEDVETYVSRLQERWPDASVRNRGVMGYGTVHAMLALERDLARDGSPALVLYGFHPIHVMRNHLRASHVTNVAGGRTPRYDIVDGALVPRGLVGLEKAIPDDDGDLLEEEWARTRLFVAEMARMAEARGARFVVVSLEGPDRLEGWDAMSRRMAKAAAADRVEVVDLNEVPDVVPATERYFADDHPNAAWHRATGDAIAARVAPPAPR